LFNFIPKIAIRIREAQKRYLSGLTRDPFFYFGLASIFLFVAIYTWAGSPGSLSNIGGLESSRAVFFNSFFNNANASEDVSKLFSNQSSIAFLEGPDFKIQDNAIGQITTPSAVSGKVLGDVFGSNNQARKEMVDYIVQPGDTVQSIANYYNVSTKTILWANDLSSSSALKVGDSITILPVDGVLHVIKSGDTITAIAGKYKSQVQDIVAFNSLSNQDDIYIGDVLIVPGGTMPSKASPINNNQVPLAENFFIFPAQGKITQGLHYYNAIDLANSCGTPVYAAAGGVVQRAVFNNAWNLGMGNYVTILHSNGTVTYYGHFQTVFVKPGDKVDVGQRIGLMGDTGKTTGCHVHFQVIGAKNPLAKYGLGATISYK
jgi:murein DD-endopeptidase MepM/ murein hydrolase activator NlpD